MLKARVITAIFLIPLFLGALFLLPDAWWVGLMLTVIALAAREWCRICGCSASFTWVYVMSTPALCISLFWFIDYDSPQIVYLYSLSAFFWALVAPFWLAGGWRPQKLLFKAVSGWVVLLPTWLAAIDLRVQGPGLLLSVMGVIWIADTAAYFSGRKFGKTKLAPAISPGKSWQGVWGAMVAVACYAVVLKITGFSSVSLPILIPAFWLLTAFSIEGDLFESLLKRQSGLKDSGSILPGHGGILDRIDSLTAALPLAAFAIYISQYLT